jgi:hypothetical protein
MLLLTMRISQYTAYCYWLGYGLLWGLIALTNPALMAFLPFAFLWIWYRSFQNIKLTRHLGAATMSLIVFITPWLVRNYLTLGTVTFRDNFGLELYLGNYNSVTGLWNWKMHPSANLHELERFRDLGEIRYLTEKQRDAVAYILDHFQLAAFLSLKRISNFWFGTPDIARLFGFRNRFPEIKSAFFVSLSLLSFAGLFLMCYRRTTGSFLFLSIILFYPLVYYVTHSYERYRHPIELMMVLLAAYFLQQLYVTVRGIRYSPERSLIS